MWVVVEILVWAVVGEFEVLVMLVFVGFRVCWWGHGGMEAGWMEGRNERSNEEGTDLVLAEKVNVVVEGLLVDSDLRQQSADLQQHLHAADTQRAARNHSETSLMIGIIN